MDLVVIFLISSLLLTEVFKLFKWKGTASKMSSTSTVTTQTTISKKTLKVPLHNEATNKFLNRQRYKCFLGEFETPIIWTNLISIALLHFGTIYGLITYPYFEKPGLVIYAYILGMLGGFGITAGAHRLWTHKSYKAKLPLKLILLFCYSLAGQNTIKEWVRDHRVHHKFSETDADPHNANRGFFFAHVGWLCMKKHPDVIKKGKQIDVSDVSEDPLIAFHIRYWSWIKLLFCFVLPTIIPPLTWGESWKYTILAVVFARWALNLNFTWSVNSAAHMWGFKPYDKNIMPVQNKWVSVVAMGEGWHNYHHTFPWDYRAAELNQSLNVTTRVLDLFAKIGWAYDMKSASPVIVKRVAENRGDGTPLVVEEVTYEQNRNVADQRNGNSKN